MLTQYAIEKGACVQLAADSATPALAEGAFWFDLLNPTREDEKAVEQLLGIELPTRAEMLEIEVSSRLYVDAGTLVMTLPVINKSTSNEPESAAITFVLAKNKLVTVRYAEPAPFHLFSYRLSRQPALASTGEQALLGLLEQITDRLADILEGAMSSLDSFSQEVFKPQAKDHAQIDFREALRRIGHVADLTTKAKDCLLNLSRLLLFLTVQAELDEPGSARIKTLMRDAKSIDEHASFLTTKVSFLLDATLGLINVEQNNIIKIFSVASVVLLPPTLVASAYGMNFQFMPELNWSYGYPFAITLMIVSAVIPYIYFRRKKWL